MTAHENPPDRHSAAETPGGEGGREIHRGDYNAQPPEPSTLPPLSPWALLFFGITLGLLLAALVSSSLHLSVARHNDQALERASHK